MMNYSTSSNPVRQRLEELAQSYQQELRTIPAYQRLPNSASMAIARQDVSLVADILDDSQGERLIDDVRQKVEQRLAQGFDLDDILRAVDTLERTILPQVSHPSSQRMLWDVFSRARAQVVHQANQLLISSEKRFQQQLQGSVAVSVAALTEVAQEIAAATGLDELFQKVVTVVKERFGYYHAQLLRYDPAEQVVLLVAGYGEVGAQMLAAGHQMPLGVGLIGTAAQTGETVLRPVLRDDPDWQPNPLLPETQGEIAVPILWQGEVLGVLDVQNAQAGALGEEDRLLLEGLCGQVAIAIQNTRLVRDLQASRERFELAVQGSSDGIWDWDIVSNLVYYSPRLKAMVGYADDEFGNEFTEFESRLHPEDHDRVLQFVGDYLSGKEPVYDIEFRFRCKDGSYRWMRARGDVLRDESGRPLRMAGAHTDVTEQRLAGERIEALVAERTEQLAANEQLLRLVMGNIPQTIFWKDRNLKYLGANQAFADDAGLTGPEEVIGKTDFDMPWKEQAEMYRADDLVVLQSGEPKLNIEEPQTTPTGDTIWLRTSKVPMRDAEGNVFAVLGMYEDITGRKHLEEQVIALLERRGYQVRVGTQIAQEIAAAPDLRTIFDRVVKLVKEQFGYYHTQILRYEPALDAVALVAGYGEVGAQMLAAGHQMPLGVGLIGTAAQTGETVLRPVLRDDPDWQPNPLLPETQGEIAVPIKLHEQVLGVLDVQSDRPAALDEEDRLLLEGLCGQIAIVIEDTRLRQETQERLRELNVLYQASTRQGWQAFRETASLAGTFVYDRLGVQHVPDEALAQRPMAERAALMQVRGEAIGRLGIYEDPARPLTEEDHQLIEQVAEQVAQALDGARLFEQTQQALSETRVLYEGSARIIAASSLDDVVLTLADVSRLGEMDQIIIEVFDRPWEQEPPLMMLNAAVWERSGGPSREPVGTTYPLEEFPFLGLLSRTEPLVVEDMLTDGRVDSHTRRFTAEQLNIRGLVFWPLVASGQWFGALAGQSSRPLKLSDEDLRQITSLAAQASSVVQSLRLQDDMRQRVRELTSLQRMMSREAWVAYQSQAGEQAGGYLYNRVDTRPLMSDSLLDPGQREYARRLEVRGEAIGMLGVHLDGDRLLLPDEEAFLTAISEQVAQAMERARLMEQTQKSAVELQAVAEVGTATATILEPEELLQQVVDLTKERFGLYHAHVYLVDESGDTLTLMAGAGRVGREMTTEGWSIPIDDPDALVARVARTRQGQMIADVRRERGYLPNPLLPKTLSELAVPLVIMDTLLGVFDVQSDRANRFTEEDVRTYRTLAAQLAVALQNAKLYAEQLSAVERLRELDNMKSAFMANMSHELRTPLNSILGFTQVIIEGLDGPTTDLMVSDLELIEKNGKHLLNLINEILDMAKIEAGRLSLNPEPLNLYELLEDVVITTSPLVRDKGLYMNLDADPSGDWMVMVDQVRMRQILINLVGNAIKFTDQGGISVEMEKLIDPAAESDLVQVRIHDTGIGIPVNKLEEVFEAFTQVDSSTTRKAGGTGLGLPISRRLMEMHGGRLWAESRGAGQGSTFFLQIPVGKNLLSIVE